MKREEKERRYDKEKTRNMKRKDTIREEEKERR